MTRPRWVGIAGPTASGKSALALEIAATWHRPVEIVSVDSALVYRGMDVGTAKPSAAERAAVPHHLIDILDPAQPYSAAQFAADATRLIGEIAARGALPLLVGGTMLYFKALVDGLDEIPAADAAIRAALDAEAAARGWPALHAELVRVDPPTAARLAPNDAQRIQRALEVWRATGRPLSSYHRRTANATPDVALIALEPASRAWLHERIARRFAAMLDAGLLDEVRRLRARGDLHLGLPSMRCVGYRQAWQALDEGLAGDALRQRVLDTGVAATRQLAKRQLTWLRGMPWRRVVACDAATAAADLRAALQRAEDERR
ncbi:tRNA (adenosine(37)-N6)-dimethylallyltransferase MiaA [Calidifontimicrobium sp. SYSU G02091]|uniref:tRNA (adenosine(37)-N6)-dimethylallyltransferase MiaA n=1 Tax=Calidifontimicrobium sp. SYSU G02091 TaxID=2926421 RepID=UPI001F52B927|nr:tRNA (adenosine(37)-N6)-dimethylallyltransferase MiaA [Calidifontimicrobium sp. SYSU G02091]MCI1192024.1 tRNA (adenosine(37)-N6)-dimethylallyltransferase MiaA [Calidifontimicrobium sp. SYSU G02091]